MGVEMKSIGIGLMGLGVIGGGVAKVLLEKGETITLEAGCPLTLKKILVRDPSKKRCVEIDPHLFTTRVQEMLADQEIDIVVEVIGGEHPALKYIEEAILRGKHVVTANKEVIAKHGTELLVQAAEHEVDILYEASVGGGIPLITSFRQDFAANKISTIYAIINGTTNYILTRMSKGGLSFPLALKQAQELGYAEASPSDDIEGLDAAYKLAILATLAFHTIVHPEDVYYEGIAHLSEHDFRYARELGYAIKLLAIAKERDNSVEVRVHPAFIPEEFLLAKVNGVYNAVQVEGDLIGKMLLYGEGAGALPTSSAIVADIISLAQKINLRVKGSPHLKLIHSKTIRPISEIETRYYLRMSILDHPGVLAQIAKTLGDHLISISSVIQKESEASTQTAEIVIMTHPAKEEAMQQALKEMEKIPIVKEVGSFIRVEA
jgi:homoserine dehydrogenase